MNRLNFSEPTSPDMTLNMPWIVLNNNGNGPVFMAGFVLGSFACLICRVAVDYARRNHECSSEDDKTRNMDTAEKGVLKVESRISPGEDQFSLEKRAGFSQVCNVRLYIFHPTSMRHFASNRNAKPRSRVTADNIAVLALRLPSHPVCESWRLSHLLNCQQTFLHRSRQ